ncbi:MATE family efflux transporter [Hespellia stercorisuis]|uniref:Multidrug export protein MepA n=1 Tax=Hespellia stercorisuis DSM 15480 TaxID=1121950 RepID=A0A1M6U3D5_9FIRM|nr:MATE family efflux transporter [Hespellia stercorisuis]SHK63680.1 putative efflux protein, MATE family [Hespellia stercorisuis DSM 15480]
MNQNRYLAEEKISTLMLKFSIPCIMSLLVSSLYNIVDQIFIGRGVGYLGNGATNVVFPITIIALSLALMLGDGCAAFLSICQGKKDSESSHRSVGNTVLVMVVISLVMTAVFAVAKGNILVAFGATENNIAYASEYFDYILIGIPFFIFGNGMNSIIRADGDPKFAMLSTLVGCVINVILDPIAIFVLGWGMKGAALATITGQIVTALLAVYYLFHSKSFTLKKESFQLRRALLGKVVPLGISSFLTQISIVVVMGVMNNTLVTYGAQSEYGADIPLTVVGIVMKVFQIVIAVVVGIAAGSQPIVGYNYGAGEFGRVKKIYAAMVKAEIVVGLVATFLFEVFPLQITSIFGSEDGLYNEFAVLSFRIYLCTMILCCVQKATSIFLQSLGKPVHALGLSLLRDFVLSVPLIILLPRFMGVTGALYSAPIADVVSIVVAVVMIVGVFKKMPVKTEEKKTSGKKAGIVVEAAETI